MNNIKDDVCKHYVLRALALLLTLILATPLHSAEFEYTYPIYGSNVKQIMQQIGQNSKSPDGAFGYTELKTHIGWTALVDSEGTCTVETVDFTYDISIYMPQWIDKYTAKQCLQDNWDIVWAEIQVHEEQHRNLYRLLDVNDINQRISSIKPRESCDALTIAINSEVENILNKNDKLHDLFHASSPMATLWNC